MPRLTSESNFDLFHDCVIEARMQQTELKCFRKIGQWLATLNIGSGPINMCLQE